MNTIYTVYMLIGEESIEIFSTTNLNEAVESAREYIKYSPTPQEIEDLKTFFSGSKTNETYEFSANDRTVKMIMTIT